MSYVRIIFTAHHFWIYLIIRISCTDEFYNVLFKCISYDQSENTFFFFITLDNALLHCEFYIDCYCSDAPRLLAVWNRICSVRNIKFCLVFVTCISAHKSFHFSESSGTLQSKINRLLGPSMLNLKVSAVSLLISVELQWVARTNSTWNLLKSH